MLENIFKQQNEDRLINLALDKLTKSELPKKQKKAAGKSYGL